jgi:hypothetical protein
LELPSRSGTKLCNYVPKLTLVFPALLAYSIPPVCPLKTGA